ncbi:MAG: UTP--glucose-1-phosphate uridylyltransferase GalU [Christensenellales bacterium]|jgi:UTP--glucose-1-phosphate uridylyltransferase
MKVRKAVIPAAGLGTRFLPATKAQPKEMLPIVDKPTIQYIVEEAIDAGIEAILIITGRNKRAIEDHFDKSTELENELLAKHNDKMLELVQDISNLVDIHYIRQKEPRGLGHAIHCAHMFIGDEPFAVLLGDDIVTADVPAIGQLMEVYEQKRAPILGVQPVKRSDVEKFGIVTPGQIEPGYSGRLSRVEGLVEKPKAEEAKSDIAILGRYIITPDIFQILEETQPGAGGEIQLTDALRTLAQRRDMYAYSFEGERYDVGDKQGFLRATVEFALNRPDLKDEFSAYLRKAAKEGLFG